MTNKEKYGNEIIELAVNAGMFVLKNGEPALCRALNVKLVIFMEIQICAKEMYALSANGLIQSMLSHLLIGTRLQSIRRFW